MCTDVAMLQACMKMVDNMGKKGYQIGTASVLGDAPCPNAGMRRTAISNGCTHDHCNAAKNQARKNLRDAVHDSCHHYISSTRPCKKVNC